jgi:hypothetical protein
MSPWIDRILGKFPPDLSRLWVACDPDAVLLDEQILSVLRERGFEVMPFEDPVAFRTEFEERYRAAWDQGAAGAAAALVLHFRSSEPTELPWDYLHWGRTVRLSLADLFPKLAYNVVRQVEPRNLSVLFEAQEAELHSVRGEGESKDFILEHVYQLTPRSIRNAGDFWRELLRLHFANRVLPLMFAEHVAVILQGKGLYADQPLAAWFSSKSVLLRVVQDSWYRYLATQGVTGSRVSEPPPPPYVAKVEIPFDHPDVRVIIDTLFLDGTLHPMAVHGMPAGLPEWLKAGIVQDPTALQDLVAEGLKSLRVGMPTEASPYRDWSDFAQRYGEVLARFQALDAEQSVALQDSLAATQQLSDERLQAWIAAKHYGDLPSLPVTKGPVMVHHIPRFLARRRAAGETKVALLVFDGLAFDQWVQIRERLVASTTAYQFEENTCFAWLPTVTSVSRQAIFSGLKPREFEDSIERTDKEESLWKTFWQNEGLKLSEVFYRKGLRQVEQLASLEEQLSDNSLKAVGLVIDEVDGRLHKERSKKDVALWVGNWTKTGFVERLFSLLLKQGFHIYLTSDHGNVEAVGVGKPNQGVIAETRGERVRVYRSAALVTDSAIAYPATVRLDIAGLPANFMPLFAGGRTAFVATGEQVVVHGGVSVEELLVPFVKVKYVIGN